MFCASSHSIRAEYFDAATELGRLLGAKGYDLIFGGGTRGLMGHVARALHSAGGRVTGVVPRALNVDGIIYADCDELVVTETMRERKAEMDRRSDAFIALPGGFGTLEEIVEHVTLKQLKYHPKPLILINTAGLYEPLIRFFDHLVSEGFVLAEHREVYHVAGTPAEAVGYLERYAAPSLPEKY